MKRIRVISGALVFLIVLCFLLSGCNGNSGNYPVTVGHTEFKESPNKVVCLSDNIADIICYIGYSSKLSGISDSCTQSELTQYVTSVGSESDPNTQLIISSGATVVFTDSDLSETAANALKEQGITVLKMLYPQSDSQLKTLYATLGAILGGDTDGRQKGSDAYDRLINTLTSAAAEIESVGKNKTACYLYLDDDKKLCAYRGGTDEGMVMSYLGVTNVAANFESQYADESILKLANPDYIFFDNAQVMEKLTSDEALKDLNAIAQSNVFEIGRSELSRMGESLIDAQAFMLSSMFPNYIDAPKVESKDLSEAYGITLTEDMSYSEGDDNANVAYIQQRLVDLGFLDLGEDSPTTYFGSMSVEALKAFQSANSLQESGIASYETLKKLFSSDALGADGKTFVLQNASVSDSTAATEGASTSSQSDDAPFTITDSTVYQSGDESEDVRAIQTRLVELMYLSFDEGDSPTTYYGAGTESAIKTFQESNGLSATGVADAQTLRVLFSDSAKLPQ